LISRLNGEPHGDGLVTRQPDGDYPSVSLARADGWVVTAAVEDGSPDPALLDTIVDRVEPFTVEQLIDSGMVGPVTTLATVDDMTVEIHGNDDLDLAICLTPTTGRPECAGVVDQPDLGFTSASLVVDGEWTVVTVTDGDEPGQVIAEPEDGWGDPMNPRPGDVLAGQRERSEGRVIEVVTVPDAVGSIVAQSPMTDAGSEGHTYLHPEQR